MYDYMHEGRKKGRIYTFYSYKGGVGRSMTLANIAVLLSKLGDKVLIIDWDLEAPGLELFFNSKGAHIKGSRENTPGVVDLLYAKAEGRTMDWHTCLLEADISGKSLHFISAGERSHDYQSRVQHIDWDELFEKHDIGDYLDGLRNQWIREYDFVLIDSRTGITDIGDICTVLLPDVLILLFISNYQNIRGIKSLMERARKAHINLPVNRSRLIGVPVHCRDEVYNEYDLSQEWKEIFAEELGLYYDDWLPRGVTARDALNKLFIPYVANWSFGERLPVVENENEINNPTSISAAYSRLTKLLTSGLDWNELVAFSDPQELHQARIGALNAKAEAERARRKSKRLATWSVAIILGLMSIISALLILNSRFRGPKAAWQTIMDARGTPGDLGRKDALQYLYRKKHSLAGLDISHAHISGLRLPGADLADANLAEAQLTEANLSGANLSDANLTRSRLWFANLSDAKVMRGNLSWADLSDANLASAVLVDANCAAADFTTAHLRKSKLIRADLVGANLTNANLVDADLTDANLAEAKLEGANLSRAVLTRANLAGAMLWGKTDLAGAMLFGANLAEANMSEANLSGADLTGANLSGAYLAGADLTGVRGWKEIKILEHANIYKVENPPDGFVPWAEERGALKLESYEAWLKWRRNKRQDAGSTE